MESHSSGTKWRRPLPIPYRIETTKRPRPQSHCRRPPPRLPYRHGRPRTSALFVSLKTAFHWSTATGDMRESTRFGATCSKSISIKHLATTTAFEVFISLTPIPPRSRNQSSVQSLPVAGWSCKVKIITRITRPRYIRGLSKAIVFDLSGGSGGGVESGVCVCVESEGGEIWNLGSGIGGWCGSYAWRVGSSLGLL